MIYITVELIKIIYSQIVIDFSHEIPQRPATFCCRFGTLSPRVTRSLSMDNYERWTPTTTSHTKTRLEPGIYLFSFTFVLSKLLILLIYNRLLRSQSRVQNAYPTLTAQKRAQTKLHVRQRCNTKESPKQQFLPSFGLTYTCFRCQVTTTPPTTSPCCPPRCPPHHHVAHHVTTSPWLDHHKPPLNPGPGPVPGSVEVDRNESSRRGRCFSRWRKFLQAGS